jgi:hypothetical protein
LVLFATLLTAMLPLTWEDEKEVWVITAMLFGMSSIQGAGVSAATSAARFRATAIARPPVPARSPERLASSGRIRGRDGAG